MIWKSLPLPIKIPEVYNWQSPNFTHRMVASNPRYLVFQLPPHLNNCTRLVNMLGAHWPWWQLTVVQVAPSQVAKWRPCHVAPLLCLLLRHRHGPCHRLWSCNCGRILHKNLLINRNSTPRSSVQNHSTNYTVP